MFIEATKLIKMPVASETTLAKIGEVKEVLIDPENGALLGFLVKTGGILGPNKILSAVDIIDWDPKGIATRSELNLVEPTEIVRVSNVLRQKIFLIGMGAQTENGSNLGKIENFLIDTETNMVVKYYLKDLLGKKRILGADKVVSIDKKIVFSDDVCESTPATAGAQIA